MHRDGDLVFGHLKEMPHDDRRTLTRRKASQRLPYGKAEIRFFHLSCWTWVSV
jgi:hypothetical protein